MDRDQVAYVPELFDIHVMAFADESDTTVVALQEIFRIERGDAQRLIGDAPVVVKRAATPQLADALIDALQRLGAQVVLLPSRERPPQPEAAPVAIPSEPPAEAPMAAPAEAAPATSAAWGGLDFDAGTAATRRATPAAFPSSPPADPWNGYSSGIPAALASDDPLDDEPLDDGADSASLELDIGPDARPERVRAALTAAERGRARAPAAEFSLPPAARRSLPGPRQPSLPPTDRDSYDPFEPPPRSASLAPRSLPPRSLAPARAIPPGPPVPPPPRKPVPPPTPHAAAPPPPPPPRRPGAPPPPPPPDLGLGTVPPLPGNPRGESVAPPKLLRSSPRPPAPEKDRFTHRLLDASDAMQLPRIDVSTPLLRASPSADAAAAAASGAPGAKPADPNTPRAPAGEKRAKGREGAEPTGRVATQGQAAAKPAEPAAKPPVVRARGRALLEVAAGMMIFYFGMHLDNTVLHGNASIVWIVLHGFGLYAIGAGIAGLWP